MAVHSVNELYVDSPIGVLKLVAQGRYLTELRLPRRTGDPDEPDTLGPEPHINPTLLEAKRELDLYFAGELKEFNIPLDPSGSAFQQAVWSELLKIPFGETTTYGALAKRLGAPNASRAVGAANGANPIAIIVPCHRVIGEGGKLVGYGGGLPIKTQLLRHETACAAGIGANWSDNHVVPVDNFVDRCAAQGVFDLTGA
jgi:methylated-DNA-[protein]-cysteine S-methyltransferase